MGSSSRLPVELMLPPPNRWDAASIGLIGVMLVFAAAAFGAVEAWSELALVVLASGLSSLLVIRGFLDRDFRFRGSWLYAPAAAWLLLAAWQLAALPSSWTATLSPTAWSHRSDLVDSSDQLAGSATLTAYPWATAHGLRLALVATTVFVAVVNAARGPVQIRLLLLVAFLAGVAEAALAVAQIFTAARQFYWSIPGDGRPLTSGSFVNYSNFSQFMNLAIGCGTALVLVALHTRRGRNRDPYVAGSAGSSEVGWLLPLLILASVSVFTSLSRNGALSLVIAAGAIGVALYVEGSLSRRGWLLAAAPLAVVLAILLFGFDSLYGRFASIRGTSELESRWHLTEATLRSWRSAPIWGWGLGTHEYVYCQFDPTATSYLAQHADNDYAQLLEETGVVGAAAAMSFFAMIAVLAVRSMCRGRTPISFAAFGLALGLIAVGIHSATDFGLRLPANSILLAVVCGLVVAVDAWERAAAGTRVHSVERRPSRPARFACLAVAALALATVWSWAIPGALAAFRGEQWWDAETALAERLATNPEPTEQDYIDLIAAGERSVAADAGQVKHRYGLSLDRWTALSRSLGVQSATASDVDDEVRPLVGQIADELAEARSICPTYGPPYSLEGQLRDAILGEARGAKLIRRGVELAPYDPPTTLFAGELAARQGQDEDARLWLNRAVELNPYAYPEVAAIMLSVDHADWAEELAGDDHARLADLARLCREEEKYAGLAQELEDRAIASLRRRAESGEATAAELASLGGLDMQAKKYARAADLFRQAIVLDYKQVEWHLQLAYALESVGKLDDAEREARIVLRLHPRHAAGTELLERLSVRTGSK